MIAITHLPESEWLACKEFRLEALLQEPLAFSSSYEQELTLSDKEWKKRIHNALFAKENELIVGMIVLLTSNQKSRHVASINGFFVKKTWRKKGIGLQLLNEAIKKAKQMNVKMLKLSVNTSQIEAISLYKKTGFEVVGTNELRDELLMEYQIR